MNKDHGDEQAEAEVMGDAATGPNDWFGAGHYSGRMRLEVAAGLRSEPRPVVVVAVVVGGCCACPRSAASLGTAHWVSEHSLAFFDGTSGHLIYTSYLAVAADDCGTDSRT